MERYLLTGATQKISEHYLWNALNAQAPQIIDGGSLRGESSPSLCRFDVTGEQPALKSHLSGCERHVCKESGSAI
ncbi:MAG: hypothetical protein WCE49_00340 [Terrimicrobiaceae bacterium]